MKKLFAVILLLCALCCTACTQESANALSEEPMPDLEKVPDEEVISDTSTPMDESEIEFAAKSVPEEMPTDKATADFELSDIQINFSLADVPPYTGSAYVPIHDNIPYFTEAEIQTTSFETYAPLDALGRCGIAYANIGQDLMPTEERGSIGQVKPSGWHTVKYDCVDGKYLYNRCHLIGYQLTAENANTSNLITGTRYLNIEGMLPFENMVADYVQETGNHVLYRVAPVFDGSNLVADGVLMEGYSVEDAGAGILYCVFAYNVQPGITIDYATGDSSLDSIPITPQEPEAPDTTDAFSSETTYILNTNTKKFHLPTCSSVDDMKESNKQEYTGSKEDLINQGYVPCKRCLG